MKKLGLDLGNKTLGLAVSDELNMFARGVETFRFEDKDFETALNYTLSLINKHKIKNQELKDLALVLADENLLLPVLEFLPSSVDMLNITMGNSLKNLNMYWKVNLTIHC